MRVLLTGAAGFLGWHTRVRLHALTGHEVVPVDRATWPRLPELAQGADAILHLAGVNRGTAEEVTQGNIDLARDVAEAARLSGGQPAVVFANSIQSGNDSPYGVGKRTASDILASTARDLGSTYVDVRLPNLFGEHGRPRYNSFVQTFVDCVVNDTTLRVDDRAVDLLHVQGAAQALLDGLLEDTSGRVSPPGTPTSVQAVFDTLVQFNDLYSRGDIPALVSDLDVDLFNTLRAARFPAHYPIPLVPHADSRGSLVEVVRAHGGSGQTFVSATRPGVTRGEHFHLRKVERFVVLSGTARISLRRMFTDEVVSFDVSGERPSTVDMPVMWVHNITNTGGTDLTTLFWAHQLFDPLNPDTFPQPVENLSLVGQRRCSR